MAAIAGRSIQIYRNGILVAGARAKSISVSGAPIDITNDDDSGVRKLLDAPGQVDVSITVSGILVNNGLQSEALGASDRVQNTEFRIGSGSPTYGFSGQFFMSAFSITGEYQGAATFEATFESADTVTAALG